MFYNYGSCKTPYWLLTHGVNALTAVGTRIGDRSMVVENVLQDVLLPAHGRYPSVTSYDTRGKSWTVANLKARFTLGENLARTSVSV